MLHSKEHGQVLRSGLLIAYPKTSFKAGDGLRNHIFIEGWDAGRAVPLIIDLVELNSKARSVHHIPVVALNECFRIQDPTFTFRFDLGGSYILESDWNYPFYGDRIGALVSRIERPNQVSKLSRVRIWRDGSAREIPGGLK